MSFWNDVARTLSFGIWPPDDVYLPEVGSLWVEKRPAITKGRDRVVWKVSATGPSLVDVCMTADPATHDDQLPRIDSPGMLMSPGVFYSRYKPLEIQPNQPWPRS